MKTLLFCLIALVLYCGSTSGAQKNYTVSGDSMAPTRTGGDTVVVEASTALTVRRGDLTSIRINSDKTAMVKRVVAVEGDKVEFRDGAVWVNGEKSGNFDAKRWQATVKQLERSNWTVPAGYLFILGDNPANSRDSKRLGLISTNQVEGRVVRVVKNRE